MTNYDTPLALAIIAAALLWWTASAIGKRRQKRRLMRLIRDTPQVPVAVLRPEQFVKSYIDTEFDRITTELDPQPTPYDHERDGL